MKKNINLFTIILLFQIFNVNCFIQKLPEPIKAIGHWALSAGPLFADAIHYVALFSEEYAAKVFGNENADSQTERFVQHILQECGITQPENIKVKLIKEEAREFVLSAIVCTDSTIFINPSIYNFLSKSEQKALITQASVMMQKNHIGTNAIFLTLIPIATHFVTELLKSGLDQAFEFCPSKDKQIPQKTYTGLKYIIGFWATKMAINSWLASLYFKYQTKRYDILTAKKLGTSKDLISYYLKLFQIVEKQNLAQNSAIEEQNFSQEAKQQPNNIKLAAEPVPGLKERLKYLLSVNFN